MYAVCVTFTLSPGQIEAFLPLMHQQAQNSLNLEPGCSRFDVLQSSEAPEIVFLYEIYDDAAAFQLHLDSTHFKEFDQAVTPLVADKQVSTYNLVFAAET